MDVNPYLELDKKRWYKAKTFTIPVSGSVVLFGPEIEIVKTAEFQRLDGIKQLGTSYVTFRGAKHTRFEHALGTLHRAEQMMQAIVRNPRPHGGPVSPANGAPELIEIKNRPRRIARLAALLHDLTHVPFGHTLEDEFALLTRHDENAERFRVLLESSAVGRILRDAVGKTEFKMLLATLKAHDDEAFRALDYPYVGDIVGNTVCADLLDYVERDLGACGMDASIGDRFLDFLTVTRESEAREVDQRRLALNLDKRGMPRPDVESEVIKLLTFRYELAERVYFHHAKNAASVMIARAVQEAGLAHGQADPATIDANFHWLSDESLLLCLVHPELAVLRGLQATGADSEGVELAAMLAKAVLDRQLFKIAYMGVSDDLVGRIGGICELFGDPHDRRKLEDDLANKAGLPRGAVLVHLPRQEMMKKPADVRVRTASGDIITLSEWDDMHSRRVDALNHAHERLWRVTVYIDPTHLAESRLVRIACEELFGARSRYVEKGVSAYARAVFDRFAAEEKWRPEDLPALEEVAALDVAETLEDARQRMVEMIRVFRRGRRSGRRRA